MLIFRAPTWGINPVWHSALISVPSHSSSPKAFPTGRAHSRSTAAGRAGQGRATATTQSSAGLPHPDRAPHPERELPPKGEGINNQETPVVQNISHLLVHTAKHSLNMHSTLIGHISTGSQVPEQSSGAGAGRAGTEPPAETFIWSWRGEGTAPGARGPAGDTGPDIPSCPSPGSECANVHRVSCRGNILLP